MLSVRIAAAIMIVLALLQFPSATPAPPTSSVFTSFPPHPQPVRVILDPKEQNVNLWLNESVLLQFTIEGSPMTTKTKMEFTGTSKNNNCMKQYGNLYRINPKALQRNSSVVCDMNYWLDSTNHHIQQLEVLLTNGEAAANVTRVVVYLRVEEADNLPIQTHTFNITFLKSPPPSQADTPQTQTSPSPSSDPVSTATPTILTQRSFIDSLQTDIHTPLLLVIIVLCAIVIVILILVVIKLKLKQKTSSKQLINTTATSEGNV